MAGHIPRNSITQVLTLLTIGLANGVMRNATLKIPENKKKPSRCVQMLMVSLCQEKTLMKACSSSALGVDLEPQRQILLPNLSNRKARMSGGRRWCIPRRIRAGPPPRGRGTPPGRQRPCWGGGRVGEASGQLGGVESSSNHRGAEAVDEVQSPDERP